MKFHRKIMKIHENSLNLIAKNRTTKRALFTRSPSIFAPPRRDLRLGAEQKKEHFEYVLRVSLVR